MTRRSSAWMICAGLLLAMASRLECAPPPPKSPAESLRAIQLRAGMQVELVASEPLVGDPIAISWGPDGRMWVVEMGDYPLGVDGKGGAGGLVRLLEDTDSDGRYDKATTFLDQLGFPTGVLPWRKGALVTCAPDIFYAEDTDGDGKADRREVLFSGFPERNQQHRVNGLQWGLDNWVHCANGDGGVGGATTIECRKQGGKKIELGGRDFRFRPDTGELDPQTGTTQFGRNRDDWGNWFGSNNAQPLYHFVLGDEYLRRNANLVPPDPRRHLLTVQGPFFGMAANVPIRGEAVATGPGPFRVGLGGPCSGVIYRDNLLGPEFTGNAFVCDPVTNLVHREILEPRGVTYGAHRAYDETGTEFFASRDSWTRPTMARTGPDGALWIVDMYRLVIEHPQWISPSAKQQLDLRAGHDLGRIYRVWPAATKPRAFPRLDKLGTLELVAALDTPGGWQRDMVQQLLLWRADPAAVEPLARMVETSANPLARLHALCTLDGLDRLAVSTVEHALRDSHHDIRRNAIRLSEPFLRAGQMPLEKLAPLVADRSAPVRIQLACSLGESRDRNLTGLLVRLGLSGADDIAFNAALLSCLRPRESLPLLVELLGNPLSQKTLPLLVRQTARLAGAEPSEAGSPEEEVALQRTFTSFESASPLTALDVIAGWFEGRGPKRPLPPRFREQAEAFLVSARNLAMKPETSVDVRIRALHLLGHVRESKKADLTALAALVTTKVPADIQIAAVDRLSQIDDDSIPQLLLEGWPSHGPAVRTRILDALLSRDVWATALLSAVNSGTVTVTDIDAPRRQQLRDHTSAAVSGPARRLFTEISSAERRRLVDTYREALSHPHAKAGDVSLGKAIFEKRCAVCHRLGNLGQSVGPDLTAFRNKPSDEWLIAILDPNRAVEPRYASYSATTTRGLLVSGVIATETAGSLTLLGADGRPQTLLRADIEELRNSGKSLMPEGLEKDLPTADMANLFAFVRSVSRRQRKVAAGNQPELVRPENDGSLRLLPGNCEIYGDSIFVNTKANCVTGLSHAEDYLIWNFETTRSHKYRVYVTCATADNGQQKQLQIEVGHQKWVSSLKNSGRRDQFHRDGYDLVEIPAGRGQILLRPFGKLQGDLADIREIHLVPEPRE